MFDGLDITPDSLEQALLDRQAEINRLRGEQIALLRALDAAQVLAVDGCGRCWSGRRPGWLCRRRRLVPWCRRRSG